MTNLREPCGAVGHVPTPPPIEKRVLFDLLALLGFGSPWPSRCADGAAVQVRRDVLRSSDWPATRRRSLLALFGVLVGLAADWLIFAWVVARLPRERCPARRGQGRRLGAVGSRC